VLNQGDTESLGSELSRARHILISGWVAMVRGDYGLASRRLADAQALAPLEFRDELWAAALTAGIARRTSDLKGLIDSWPAARTALLRNSVDLYVLLPLSELMMVAARLQEGSRIESRVLEARQLLGRLGEPPLWSRHFHWAGVQAALLSQHPADMEPHAAALVTAASIDPTSAVLASAGRAWTRALMNLIDVGEIEAATAGLQKAGYCWDAARLAGQAAARATDRRAMVRLLELARELARQSAPPDLAADIPAIASGGAPSESTAVKSHGTGVLSGREQEVARLMLAGRTYREIGSQLFISAKTVEHHVSRIRKRVGAANRSDLFVRLRAELGTMTDIVAP
jgi:DNA-binding CsgD family transcriptional regulator